MANGFLSNLKKDVNGAVPRAPAPAAQPSPTEEPLAVVEPNTGEVMQASQAPTQAPTQAPAPWAFDACPMCKDSAAPGIHNGAPCNICVVSTNAEKENGNPDQPVLEDFDVVVNEDGTVTWNAKCGEPVAEAKVVEEEPVVKEAVQSLSGDEFDQEEPVAVDTPPEENAEARKPVDIFKELDPKELPLERSGFLLSYNALRSRKRQGRKLGDANCVASVQEILEFISGALLTHANAKGACAQSWHDVEVWARRDLIDRHAGELSTMIRNSMIDASCVVKGSDEERLCAALERYAEVVCGEMK